MAGITILESSLRPVFGEQVLMRENLRPKDNMDYGVGTHM